MSQKQYSQYKESRIDFIGQIPSHWETRKLKFNVSKVGSGITPKGGAEGYEPEGIPLLRSQNVHFDGLRLDDVVYISEATHKEMSNSQVSAGDVLLNITGASIGRCHFVDENLGEANVNQHVCIIRPDSGLLTGFLCYIMASEIGQQQIDLDQTGSGREGLNFLALKNFIIPITDENEQQRIVDFLDWKTGQIDSLIAKKKELIERLKEKRIALITQAVTKGLNPDVPMRDSGIPWLSKIPAHWSVRRLKFLASIRYGLGEPPEYVEEGLNFIRATDISKGTIAKNGFKKIRPEDAPWNKNPVLREKEIIVVRSGAYTGDSAIVPKDLEGSIAGFDMVVTAIGIKPEILAWALLSRYLLKAQIYQTRLRAAQPHLNSEELGNFFVVVPAPSEQSIINDYIVENVGKTEEMINRVETVVERLAEYRTALITAAVTGKFDVRNVEFGGSV